MLNMFKPKTVAVIGASDTKGKIGHDVLKNLTGLFPGKIVPINTNATEVMGLKAYPTVSACPDKVDLAIFCIPSKFVLEAIEDCGKSGVKSVVVISAGFKEVNPAGAEMEKQIAAACKKYKMELVGPNCLGIIDTHAKLNGSFAKMMAITGDIAFMSQSGAIMTAMLDWADARNVGFSRVVSLGNKAGVNEKDCLEDFAEDPNTKVIAAYLEEIVDGPAFMEAAKVACKKKPIVLIKSGTTDAGSAAVSSHTGSIAGADQAYTSAFKQSGIIRAKALDEMMNYSMAFSACPLPKGRNIAIITNAGGPGIMATDAVINNNMKMAKLKDANYQKLKSALPEAASAKNPIDVLGDAKPDRYALALDTALEDENVDGIIFLVTPQSVTEVTNTAQLIIDRFKSVKKPILCVFFGGTLMEPGEKMLQAAGIPNYTYPEAAIETMRALCDYADILKTEFKKPETFKVDKEKVKALMKKQTDNNDFVLGLESIDILEAYGLPLVGNEEAATVDDAVKAAEKMGYPVVMKIVSPDITHKSDAGGIRLNLKNKDEVKDAYAKMMVDVKKHVPNAKIEGVQIQQMLIGGNEIIIGMIRDPTFGPLVMFGLGGIYVEILKDVSFGVAPLNRDEAEKLIRSIKTFKIFEGARGAQPVDINILIDAVLRVSQLVTDFPEIKEFEINPMKVMDDGKTIYAIDMRMML
ncbi:acetate--CoA ligase alpha subunit [Methanolapillus millepedarum]|uniref:acetate--CoA ligase (ADP-forming) n=1 Tax=Methanolapillus millepedarum TaxID=3028296 RepID=A0AA96VBQ3_9EURY|nr:Peptidyl-lysine N-acetyltransferase PatZ [Methanosarcinaceae archaeon Ac7]